VVLASSRTYDRRHKAGREHFRPIVNAGDAHCTELVCLEELDGHTRWIQPGTPWDLAHDRAAGPGRYLGPAHARCNRSEGARWRDLQHQPVDDTEPEPTGYVL